MLILVRPNEHGENIETALLPGSALLTGIADFQLPPISKQTFSPER